MATKIPLRAWATPLTIGSFFLMAVTGFLMFVGLDTGQVYNAHQWLSIFFLIGVGSHVIVNFRAFNGHFKHRSTRFSLAIFAALLMASFSSWGFVTKPAFEMAVFQSLLDAPLSALAEVTQTDTQTLLQTLADNGMTATGVQSLNDVATKGIGDPLRLLGLVFLTNDEP